jgi:hypothetical protein
MRSAANCVSIVEQLHSMMWQRILNTVHTSKWRGMGGICYKNSAPVCFVEHLKEVKGGRAELAKISAPHPLMSAHRLKEKKIYEKVKLMISRHF